MLVFLPLLWWKSHKRKENEKINCIIIETNDKNKSTKWKIQGRCFQMRTQSQMAFQDGGLRVSFYALYVSARINCRFVYNLNHDRFKWSFKLFLVINVLSKATFLLHILCRLWMTILSLFCYWLVKGFWSWDVFYTPRWISTGMVAIFSKNQQKKIPEAHWFNPVPGMY